MRVAKTRRSRLNTVRLKSGLNGKKDSFRDLRAFGIWAGRADLKDPVQFTKQLRARMEQASDGRSYLPEESNAD